MKNQTLTLIGFAFVGTSLCHAQAPRNVLVIVADDLGKEVLSIYDTPTKERAKTPNINRLAKQGVVFDNFWGYPLSAPVRAAMLTGRYGHHTGIVNLNITLPTSEQTLFEALPEGYVNAAIGKWHLSRDNDFAPDYGIDHFAGFATGGGVRDYNNWQFTEDGTTVTTKEYVTTKITNSAKVWIEEQTSPWVCWVAYNAPHTPLHSPPQHMHTRKLENSAEEIKNNPLPYLLAMVESLDYEIGRLLESVDRENTTIIFVGDNGTENGSLQSPYPSRHGKGTLYEAGVSVPLVVCTEGVPKRLKRSDALVSSVDIFPTVMELTGESMAQYEDGYSFSTILSGGEGLRRYNFSEINNMRTGYMNAISDGEYKLITTLGKETMLFNLTHDPLEERNLLDNESLSTKEQAALNRLVEELHNMNIPEIEPVSNNNNNNRPNQRGQRGNRAQMRNNRG